MTLANLRSPPFLIPLDYVTHCYTTQIPGLSTSPIPLSSLIKVVVRRKELSELKISIVVVVVNYPTPSEGWGHGKRPWSPRSRATIQGWARGRRGTESRQRVSDAKSPQLDSAE